MPLPVRLVAALVASSCLLKARAVQYGDEAFEQIQEGYFYVFCNGEEGGTGPTIDVVDPVSQSVIEQIVVDPGTSWADPAYMEPCSSTEASEAPSKLVIAADNGDTSQIYVLDAAAHEVISQIEMSTRPVHSYALPTRDEFWVHADGDGVFDVVHVGHSLGRLYVEDIRVHDEVPGHGKLLWDTSLMPYAYATSTTENNLFKLDISSSPPTLVDTLHFDETECGGTHGIAYSHENNHIYATCSGTGGDVEIDVSQYAFDVVTFHPDLTGGQLYSSPGTGELVVDIDKGQNEVTFLTPGDEGEASSTEHPPFSTTLDDDSSHGGPDKPAFFHLASGQWRAFFSLTLPKDEAGNSGMWFVDSDQVDAGGEPGFVKTGSTSASHRHIRAGGPWVAQVQDYPEPALALVDGESATSYANIPVNANPRRVQWVPKGAVTKPYCPSGTDDATAASGESSSSSRDDSSDGKARRLATIALVLAAIACALAVANVAVSCVASRRSGAERAKFEDVQTTKAPIPITSDTKESV